MLIHLWYGLALGVLLAGVGQGAVLVQSPFTNHQQVVQHWFTGGSTADAIVSNGTLVLVNIPNGATRGALTYLTDGSHPLHLQPGEELTVSFHYSYGQADPSDWGLMFGFFYSGGKRVRQPDGSYNNAIFETYRGYVGAGVFGATKAERFKIARRIRPANNLLSSAAYEALGVAHAQTGGIRPSETCSASLHLAADAAGGLKITATIDHQAITSWDTAAVTDFDTLGIFATRHPFQFTIWDLLVNYGTAGGGKKTTGASQLRH